MERLSKKELVREHVLFNSNHFGNGEEKKHLKEFPGQVVLHLAEKLDCECLEKLISQHKTIKTKSGRICIKTILIYCKDKRKSVENYVKKLPPDNEDLHRMKESLSKVTKKEYELILSFLTLQNDFEKLHGWLNQSVKHIYDEIHVEDKRELISMYSNYPYFHEFLTRIGS